jgi:DNA-binding NtrC family response regulator
MSPLDEPVYQLLVIDDDPLSIQFVADALESEKFRVHGVTDASSGLDFVAQHRPAVVLLDLVMPNVSGLEVLKRIQDIDPEIDVFLFTGHYSTDSAVEAIQEGAYDYLTKPLPVERLREKLARWFEEAHLRQQTRRLDGELLRASQFGGIVGHSPLMLEVFSRIRRIAPHFQTALVTGDTGTGKELVAKALHQLSPRASGPFVVCNCAAISDTLFESELFGHVRGAFTSASQDRQGFVEAASGGTLFLDEVAELPLAIQAKVLRLLQNREIQRIGTSRPQRVDVRIVAATNRDLRSLVAEKTVREDLYYRLATVEVKLPRLADRKEDLPLLQRHFLEEFSIRYGRPGLNLTRRAQALLAAYSWPGNIRELENVLGYCSMMTESNTIDARDLPEQIRLSVPSADAHEELMSMEQMETTHALRVLDRVAGNRLRAAQVLGISRATLYRIIGRSTQRPPGKAQHLSHARLTQRS